MGKQDNLINKLKSVEQLLATQASLDGIVTGDLFFLDFVNFGMKLFELENLPKNNESRIIEHMTFTKGMCGAFESKYGLQWLPITFTGELNPAGYHTMAKPIALGELAGELSKPLVINEEIVIYRDNELCVPPILYASYYADKVSKLYSMREKNNVWANMPLIIKSSGDSIKDKKNAKTIKDIFFSNGLEVATITDAFGNVEIINVKAQYLGAELQQQIQAVKNDYYQYLGVDHREEKKERMITQEANMQQDETSINLVKRRSPRETAIKRINELWGYDIKLKTNKLITATSEQDTTTQVNSVGMAKIGG